MKEYLISSKNLSVSLISYGAAVKDVIFDGVSVAAGFDSAEKYTNDTCYFGAVVGRTANRCSGKTIIDGKEYHLSLNENKTTHLHGGWRGFSKKIWSPSRVTNNSVTFSFVSPDGDEGYPGNLVANVTYTVEENRLIIAYDAVCDRDTWVCLTNHTYFLVNGTEGIFGTKLTVDADSVSTYDATMCTSGREAVKGDLDFRREKPIRREYDHNYFLNKSTKKNFGSKELFFAARARGEVNLSVWTDMPCVQLYTGNFIPEKTSITHGRVIGKNSALCLETQYEPGFQSRGECVLRKGKKFDSMTVFVFENDV